MQDKTLIIAYGNRDREDDGAGWHILDKLAHRLGLEAPQLAGEQVSTPEGSLTLLYLFQLLPEMAEDIWIMTALFSSTPIIPPTCRIWSSRKSSPTRHTPPSPTT